MSDQSTLLSQSLAQSNEQSQLRDPFQQARNLYESNNAGATTTTLSKSPAPLGKEALFTPAQAQDYTTFAQSPLPAELQKLGIPDKGLSLSEIGKMQFQGRLKSRFGDDFQTNPQAMNLIKMFDASLGKSGGTEGIKAAVSGAERTLKALLGG